jgi:non-ribosomal peptide synthetase component E (peptide arylation enzyme)
MTAVVAHKCSLTGELSAVAFVAPKCINLYKLREYLCGKMPQYMIPTYIKRVEEHEFPRTFNGKIDRKGLEEDESIHNHDQTFENSSLNERQRTVAMLCCRVSNTTNPSCNH